MSCAAALRVNESLILSQAHTKEYANNALRIENFISSLPHMHI
jgi:hypothetical protein